MIIQLSGCTYAQSRKTTLVLDFMILTGPSVILPFGINSNTRQLNVKCNEIQSFMNVMRFIHIREQIQNVRVGCTGKGVHVFGI